VDVEALGYKVLHLDGDEYSNVCKVVFAYCLCDMSQWNT
jgi:hypothetical protein